MARLKKIRRTTSTVEEEEAPNPTTRHVRDFLETGIFPDELRDLQYRIDVQKYNREGKPVKITNAVFNNLEELPDRLGARFGAARFRLFVSVFDEAGKKVAFIRVEDYEVESAGDAPAAGADRDAEAGDDRKAAAIDLQVLKMQQDHDMLVRMMDANTKIVIAALTAKGGAPGGSLSTLLQAVKVGRDLAGGGALDLGDDTGGGGGDGIAGAGGGIMELLSNPIIQKLAGAIIDASGRPATGSPAPVGGAAGSGMAVGSNGSDTPAGG